jgi:hypothetical protein
MRKLRAIGLVTLGLIAGAGGFLVWNTATVRAQSEYDLTRRLNARFVVGNSEVAVAGDPNVNNSSYVAFRFLRDKKTGDCYLAWMKGDSFTNMNQMIKTDDEACAGLN